MRQFEILASLPAYGLMALPFPPHGLRACSEGFVVRFLPEATDSWIGNFQRGHTWFDTVLAHPDRRHVVVIAGGAGYVIDPENRQQIGQGKADALMSSGQIASAEYLPELSMILLSDSYRFGAVKASGAGWTSTLINWNLDMRNVAIYGERLKAEVLSPNGDRWLQIELNLSAGGFPAASGCARSFSSIASAARSVRRNWFRFRERFSIFKRG